MTATETILISSDDEDPATESANAIIILSDSEEEDSSEDSSDDELGKHSRSSYVPSPVGSVYANSLERRYEDDLNGRNEEEVEWWTGSVEDGYPGEDNWT